MNLFIIINGFSTGASLVDKLATKCIYGTKFMHLVTDDAQIHKVRFDVMPIANNPNYAFEINYDGNLSKLFEDLKIYNIIGVVCGCESEGVILRDLIAEHFNLPNNDMNTLNCRINKYYMTEQLKKFGLPHIKQAIVQTQEDLRKILPEFLTYPLILKPLDSSGSDGVISCISQEMVINEFNKLHNKNNKYKRIIDKMLIQTFIYGEEFAVNSITFNSKRYVTDIWRYDVSFSQSGVRLCNACTLVSDVDMQLIQYVNNCLDALGCYYGAAHTEVIRGGDGSYYMLENAFRLMGGITESLLNTCLETTQLDALVTLFTDPDNLKLLQFKVKKIVKLINLFTQENGVVEKIKNFNLLKNLKSYHDSALLVSEGSQVSDANVLNRLARVVLISEDPNQVEADYQKILEQQGEIFIIRSNHYNV